MWVRFSFVLTRFPVLFFSSAGCHEKPATVKLFCLCHVVSIESRKGRNKGPTF